MSAVEYREKIRFVPVKLLAVPLISVAGLVLLGCGSNDGPRATVAWHVRCDISGGCINPESRSIDGQDGSGGRDVTCSMATQGEDLRLTWSVETSAGAFLEIRDAVFSPGGGALTQNGCKVTVEDDGNLYEGNCGATEPSDSCKDDDPATTCLEPCQVFDLTQNGGVVGGKLRCFDLPSRANALVTRELTGPGGATPVTFSLSGCTLP